MKVFQLLRYQSLLCHLMQGYQLEFPPFFRFAISGLGEASVEISFELFDFKGDSMFLPPEKNTK
jgi:hypothetical protein